MDGWYFNEWTGNGTEFTIAFNLFWDENYENIIYDGDIKTLFPVCPDLTPDMQAAIKDHFWYRQIGEETPQKFLRHFQRIILDRAYSWKKLIESEKALRDDDMIYNYDLTEDAEGHRTDAGTATNSGSNTGTGFISDTPDGNIADIENYMSQSNKNVSNSTGNSSTIGNSDSSSHLRRVGNIGVMTSAQIMGGYREATEWSAYNVMYAELEKCFLGVF